VAPPLLAEPAALSLAAQLACAPLLASAFGTVGWASPLANALAVPLLPAYLGASLAAGGLGWVDPGRHLPATAVAFVLVGAGSRLLWALASTASSFPLLLWHGAWPPLLIGAYYLALSAWWLLA
jgi:competence protein ComEC